MKKFYFQIGMIIGDTEDHNKICGFRGGNGLYRRYVCRDCLVSTEDADNPDIGCERRKVSDLKMFLNKFLDKMHIPMENCHVSHLSIVSPNLMANTQQQTGGAMLYRIILLCLH